MSSRDEEACTADCKDTSYNLFIILGIIGCIIGSSLGIVSYNWLTVGRVADRLDVHRYCFSLAAASCRGASSTSNITGDGYVLIDLGNGLIKHRLFLINAETNVPTELAIQGPRTIDDPTLTDTVIPSSGTFNITLDADTNIMEGTYRLKTTERDDTALARAVVKDPYLYSFVLTTEEDATGASCATILNECRVAYDYDKNDYP
jgi:hypothetical protein